MAKIALTLAVDGTGKKGTFTAQPSGIQFENGDVITVVPPDGFKVLADVTTNTVDIAVVNGFAGSSIATTVDGKSKTATISFPNAGGGGPDPGGNNPP